MMADKKKLYGDRLEEQIWIHRCLECRGQVKQLEDPEIVGSKFRMDQQEEHSTRGGAIQCTVREIVPVVKQH